MHKIINIMLAVLVVALTVDTVKAESQYGAGATAAGIGINFGASDDAKVITHISAKEGTGGKDVQIYARSGSPYTVVTASTSGSYTVFITNANYQTTGITTNDKVIYQHSDGTVLYTTALTCTAYSLSIALPLTKAGTTADRVYELSQQYVLYTAPTQAVADISVNTWTGDIFKTPSDSPLRIFLNSATNGVIGATVK